MTTLPQLIANAVETNPDGVALVLADGTGPLEQVGYADLDAWSSRLARALIARGIGPEDLVAVAIPRSLDAVLAVWAVAKTGAGFVPIDPAYPPGWVAHLLVDAGAVYGLAVSWVRTELPEEIEWLQVDTVDAARSLEQFSADPVTYADRVRPLRAEHPVYVTYAADGETLPDGVVVTQAGLSGLCSEQQGRFRVEPDDRTLNFAPVPSDSFVLELLLALGGAAAMVVVSPLVSRADELAALLQRTGVTHAYLPTDALELLDPTGLDELAVVIAGRRPCSDDTVRRWAIPVTGGAPRALYQGYGPAEVTVMTGLSSPLTPGGPPTLGAPIRGVTAYVLDAQLAAVPDGEVGELYLGGLQLARGYHRRPGRTAQLLVADPFAEDGSRLYRTGDLVRRGSGGVMEYVGRVELPIFDGPAAAAPQEYEVSAARTVDEPATPTETVSDRWQADEVSDYEQGLPVRDPLAEHDLGVSYPEIRPEEGSRLASEQPDMELTGRGYLEMPDRQQPLPSRNRSGAPEPFTPAPERYETPGAFETPETAEPSGTDYAVEETSVDSGPDFTEVPERHRFDDPADDWLRSGHQLAGPPGGAEDPADPFPGTADRSPGAAGATGPAAGQPGSADRLPGASVRRPGSADALPVRGGATPIPSDATAFYENPLSVEPEPSSPAARGLPTPAQPLSGRPDWAVPPAWSAEPEPPNRPDDVPAADITPNRTRPAGPPEVVERPATIPLSPGQLRWWEHNRAMPGSTVETITAAMRLTGNLDATAMQAAVADVVDRHETLRTVYPATAGGPEQVVLPRELAVPEVVAEPVPATELGAWLHAIAQTDFDVADAEQVPVRFALAETGPREHVVAVVVHRILADDVSAGLLLRDLLRAFLGRRNRSRPLWQPLSIQYLDYFLGRRAALGDLGDPRSLAARRLAYWREYLADLPPRFEFPARTDTGAADDGVHTFEIGTRTHRRIAEIAQRAGTSDFVVLRAAFAVLLARSAAVADVVLGSSVRGSDGRELDDAIGPYANTVALRTRIDPAESFLDLVQRVAESDRETFANADLPFELLIAALDIENPLFDVAITLRHNDVPRLEMPNLATEPLEVAAAPDEVALRLVVDPHRAADGSPDGIAATFRFATDRIGRTAVAEVARRFQRVLTVAGGDPDGPVGDIDLLSRADLDRLLVVWNDTRYPVTPELLLDGYRRTVAVRPDTVAVADSDTELSYREFDARVNRLARRLIEAGVGAETVVGIATRPTPDLVVAIYAVLTAGAAYLPLDPRDPVQWTAQILDTAVPALILADRASESRAVEAVGASQLSVPVLPVDSGELGRYSGDPVDAAELVRPARPGNPACVLCGSAAPDGPELAILSHTALNNQITLMLAQTPLGFADVYLQRNAATATTSLWGFFLPLRAGAELVLTGPADVRQIAETVSAYGVTVTDFGPAELAEFAEHLDPGRAGSLREIFVTGEPLAPETVSAVRGRCNAQLHNLYGTAETAVSATSWPAAGSAERSVPIGLPQWNTRVYVLDSRLRPVPPGVPGELYLAGDQLARGYAGRAAPTADRFVANPFGYGQRMYRTGDLVLWRDATHTTPQRLDLIGRTDHQIRFRGHRIRPDLLVAALRTLPGIADAAILPRTVAAGSDPTAPGSRLAAYVVPEPGADTDLERVRAGLARLIPAVLLPVAYQAVEQIPLNAAGEPDRDRLPEPDEVPVLTAALDPGPVEFASEERGGEAAAGSAAARSADSYGVRDLRTDTAAPAENAGTPDMTADVARDADAAVANPVHAAHSFGADSFGAVDSADAAGSSGAVDSFGLAGSSGAVDSDGIVGRVGADSDGTVGSFGAVDSTNAAGAFDAAGTADASGTEPAEGFGGLGIRSTDPAGRAGADSGAAGGTDGDAASFPAESGAGIAAVSESQREPATDVESSGGSEVSGELPATPTLTRLLDNSLPGVEVRSIVLDLPAARPLDHTEAIVRALVTRHPMLTARLELGTDTPTLWIAPRDQRGDHQYWWLDPSTSEHPVATDDLVQAAADALDPATGRNIHFVVTGPESARRLVIVANGLAVDDRSWRVIVDELITGETAPTAAESRLPQLLQALDQRARSIDLLDEAGWWRRNLAGARTAATLRSVDLRARRRVSLAITAEGTAAVTAAADAYQATVPEVLLTAVAIALRTDDQGAVAETLGSLVRCDADARSLVSRSDDLVGGFVTEFPLSVRVTDIDTADALVGGPAAGAALVQIRDLVRSVPDGGAGYALLRYLSAETSAEFAAADSGRFTLRYRDLRPARVHTDGPADAVPLVLTVDVTDDGLLCRFDYATEVFLGEDVKTFAEHWVRALGGLAEHGLRPTAPAAPVPSGPDPYAPPYPADPYTPAGDETADAPAALSTSPDRQPPVDLDPPVEDRPDDRSWQNGTANPRTPDLAPPTPDFPPVPDAEVTSLLRPITDLPQHTDSPGLPQRRPRITGTPEPAAEALPQRQPDADDRAEDTAGSRPSGLPQRSPRSRDDAVSSESSLGSGLPQRRGLSREDESSAESSVDSGLPQRSARSRDDVLSSESSLGSGLSRADESSAESSAGSGLPLWSARLRDDVISRESSGGSGLPQRSARSRDDVLSSESSLGSGLSRADESSAESSAGSGLPLWSARLRDDVISRESSGGSGLPQRSARSRDDVLSSESSLGSGLSRADESSAESSAGSGLPLWSARLRDDVISRESSGGSGLPQRSARSRDDVPSSESSVRSGLPQRRPRPAEEAAEPPASEPSAPTSFPDLPQQQPRLHDGPLLPEPSSSGELPQRTPPTGERPGGATTPGNGLPQRPARSREDAQSLETPTHSSLPQRQRPGNGSLSSDSPMGSVLPQRERPESGSLSSESSVGSGLSQRQPGSADRSPLSDSTPDPVLPHQRSAAGDRPAESGAQLPESPLSGLVGAPQADEESGNSAVPDTGPGSNGLPRRRPRFWSGGRDAAESPASTPTGLPQRRPLPGEPAPESADEFPDAGNQYSDSDNERPEFGAAHPEPDDERPESPLAGLVGEPQVDEASAEPRVADTGPASNGLPRRMPGLRDSSDSAEPATPSLRTGLPQRRPAPANRPEPEGQATESPIAPLPQRRPGAGERSVPETPVPGLRQRPQPADEPAVRSPEPEIVEPDNLADPEPTTFLRPIPDVETTTYMSPIRDHDPRADRSTLLSLFDAQVARTSADPAVRQGARLLSYAELDRKSRALSVELVRFGVGAQTPVAVAMRPGIDLVVAVCALLRAGGAYVPVDPGGSPEDIDRVLTAAEPICVLSLSDVGFTTATGIPVVAIDLLYLDLPTDPAADPAVVADDIAEIRYRPGTATGVAGTHRQMVERLRRAQRSHPYDATDLVLHAAPTVGDITLWELFRPLHSGAQILMPDHPGRAADLARSISAHKVTIVHVVPSLLDRFLDSVTDGGGQAAHPSLRRLVVDGAALPAGGVERFMTQLPGAELVIWYGHNETGVITVGSVGGRPVTNDRVYLLDEQLRPVPPGTAGEMYIGGPQLAHGFYAAPGDTAVWFVATAGGGRLYRTGDIVRRRDGVLEYLGRVE